MLEQALKKPRSTTTNKSHNPVDIEGLEDLFEWASQTLADGVDNRVGQLNEQKIKKQVLKIIHTSADLQAKSKYTEEFNYLQRRIIALQSALTDKLDEVASLRQIIVWQYYLLLKIPELQEKIQRLESITWYREEAEEERKQIMAALAKVKRERDYLDDMVNANETENIRLTKMLSQARCELDQLRSRAWWKKLLPEKLLARFTNL